MDIRPWTYEDIYSIAELEKQCFSDPWSFQMLADSFFGENTLTAVAEREGKVEGYAFLVGVQGEADLANIAVSPSFRRRGAANALLDYLEGEAKKRGTERIFLEVRVSNSPALMLYLRHGFQGVYARSRYYADGEDALVMWKELA